MSAPPCGHRCDPGLFSQLAICILPFTCFGLRSFGLALMMFCLVMMFA